MEYFLVLGICFVVYIIRLIVYQNSSKPKINNTNVYSREPDARINSRASDVRIYSREPDLARIQKLTDEGMKRLSNRGLERLMLDDYTFKTKLSSPANTSLTVIQEQLQLCLNEILFRFHVLPVISLVVEERDSNTANSAIGLYSPNKIKILVKNTDMPEMLIAALCHESVHYLMHFLLIADKDSDMDEGLTDVISCLAGFSDTMIQSNADRPAPYLINPEFREVKRILLSRRPELQRAYRQEKARQSTMTQLRKNCNGAREMISLARNLLKTSVPSASLSKNRFAVIQKAMLALETGDYDRRIQRAEQIKDENLTEVLKADEDVMRICGEIFEVLQAYR